MENMVVWFDLPANDLKRAMNFYSKILNIKMEEMDGPEGHKCAFFPFAPNVPSGCLVQGPNYQTSDKGSLVYLNGGNDLSDVLDRVEEAGGTVLVGKTSLGEHGYMARFKDTEGNQVALHSKN